MLEEMNDKTRRRYYSKINDVVRDDDLAAQLEKIIHEYSQNICVNEENFRQIYNSKVYDVISNINGDIKGGDQILKQVKDNKIAPRDLVYMMPYELRSDLWDGPLRVRQNLMDKVSGSKNTSKTVKCKKCHQKTCVINSMQTRSADEQETIFITCMNCGHTTKS